MFVRPTPPPSRAPQTFRCRGPRSQQHKRRAAISHALLGVRLRLARWALCWRLVLPKEQEWEPTRRRHAAPGCARRVLAATVVARRARREDSLPQLTRRSVRPAEPGCLRQKARPTAWAVLPARSTTTVTQRRHAVCARRVAFQPVVALARPVAAPAPWDRAVPRVHGARSTVCCAPRADTTTMPTQRRTAIRARPEHSAARLVQHHVRLANQAWCPCTDLKAARRLSRSLSKSSPPWSGPRVWGTVAAQRRWRRH